MTGEVRIINPQRGMVVNLSPVAVMETDATARHPGLDNHGMGTVFEQLIRRFNEENNEEAGEHLTPRDAVTLMAKLVSFPIADEIESGTYLLCDGACGTGGMLTGGENVLQHLAEERGSYIAIDTGDSVKSSRRLPA